MVTVAIFGSGAIAHDHAAALAGISGVRVSHVVGSDLGRAAAVAARLPGAIATVDAAAVLADDTVQAVNVCGVTDTHARWTIRAARAGKHVHVEKPAALTLADFDAMTSAIDEAGTSLMVGQTARFQPIARALHAAIAAGEIGRPRLIDVSWWVGHVWPGGWRSWQLDAVRSGGHPVHNGVHVLDLACWLTGRQPIRVFARGFNGHAAGQPVPDSFHLTVRFDDDSMALLQISYALRPAGAVLRRALVAGDIGTLSHSSTDDDPDPQPASVSGAMAAQLRHWVAMLRGEERPIVRSDQVRAALAAGLAAQRSLETGQPQEVAQ